MKIFFLITIISGLALSSFGQKLSFHFYANSKMLNASTINEANKFVGRLNQVHVDFPFGDETMIGYLMFTDYPVWFYVSDTAKIGEAMNKFDLGKYFRDGDFERELQTGIEKGSITDIFLLKSLGEPDSKKKFFEAGSGFELWNYSNRSLLLKLKSGRAISYVLDR